MLEWTLIILLSVSILLFILSFFQKDKSKEVERQMENFSITLMQEIYQLKKKIRILEEELLLGPEPVSQNSPQNKLSQDVIQFYEEGYSIEEISDATTLTPMEVERILRPYLNGESGRGSI
ncbi:hypothetical protein [Halalkalibacter urbisdiaboli]|uniref:hypothetical protein n=1 Tax=Halalkalibacter urbisdiaboli TaxID=1960589 RepID=UPI000B42DBCF|nr:hypothetical protein [Halalkalibacter urbisdiaboli]